MKKLISITAAIVCLVILTNACKEKKYKDYQQTASGLLYKFEVENKDALSPKPDDFLYLSLSYRTDNDSIVFEEREINDIMRPSFYPGDLYEAYGLMHEGDVALFVMKADSFFINMMGIQELPAFILPETMLEFRIKLNKIKTMQDFEKEETESIEKYIKDNNIKEQALESGLYFIETQAGTGAKVDTGKTIVINYTGKLLDGTVFDSSIGEGKEPMEFKLQEGMFIKGFTEGLLLMKEKGKATLLIPSKIGYGPGHPQSPIPPFSPLLFELEILSVK
ncbi:MAG: FKBP-type peptidyl-prolyl cis-trans isomerase [Bacteroidales bacterium]|jgi:FKBP-type peptidyl-prolyl cis-trans isomerase|nr:FKBP-type peptidyl-prolyl cis-trans isomerase [Bacteroidales bacterium]MDD2687200.1 FKBP-type peptidyl-prolyl cis-trans isomerase [Bacteroidales bacterium]MDD3330268.1 FKBP-type peptidyl-prolyl cis-trans isomerase [Bacteroidales bacterium]MDD3690557.1 FKBP-type peptidyl-prolyl cis-trans isomerase [Bacteroidales bacterium]MDD4043888.1 FKBP-type peptidyl-prolyl cis-trans isomerase [Bacteroidales bacterium]